MDDLNNTQDLQGQEAEPILYLTDESGNDIPFYLLDLVPYQEQEYVVLLPADNEEDGEVVILLVETDDDETESYSGVEDQDTLDAVYQLFKERNADLFTFED